MNPNKALWEKGDFTRIAITMRKSGEAFVAQLGIAPGMKILDLGCGDGTTAIPEAKLGADVLGVDIARNLVETGNARAKAEGLTNISFQEGDATELRDLEDETFNMVVSVFGAMFAPKPFDVAREMVRVLKPGGKIIMGNWIPGDPTLVAQVLKISSAYTPPPAEGFISPMLWGVADNVKERFVAAGIAEANISVDKESFSFTAACTPSELLQDFKNYYGPTMNAFEAAEKNGQQQQLEKELDALLNAQSSATDGTTAIKVSFLKVIVLK